MKFAIFFVVVVLVLVSSTCFAITPRIQFGEAWGVSTASDKFDITASSPATQFGVGASTPINDQWVAFGDLFLAVPRTKFYPGIRPVVGVARKFDGWSLACSLMYQWSPPYADGSKAMHVVGPTAAMVIPLSAKGVSFSFGLGYRAQFTGDKIFHVLSAGPALSFAF